MSFRPFDRRRDATLGAALVLREWPEVRLRFRFMGREGEVIARLEADCLPERVARDMILRQKDCAVRA